MDEKQALNICSLHAHRHAHARGKPHPCAWPPSLLSPFRPHTLPTYASGPRTLRTYASGLSILHTHASGPCTLCKYASGYTHRAPMPQAAHTWLSRRPSAAPRLRASHSGGSALAWRDALAPAPCVRASLTSVSTSVGAPEGPGPVSEHGLLQLVWLARLESWGSPAPSLPAASKLPSCKQRTPWRGASR